jgi:deoxyribose-phosphate aldolase
MAEIAIEVKPNFIKTSTGFGTSGAKVEDVKLMKSVVGDTVQVKAAGGIRNSDDFLAMVRAGATRIGCSAGVKIIEALKQRMKDDGVTSIDIKTEY